ncbi:MAG TPA: serine/threonine-protein kinase [Candidatus Angelobacter sp.]|jgi:serine/threonine protein kinase|nr:serine/threonine-protein kinase [Candidatus Angelobacter sp.]
MKFLPDETVARLQTEIRTPDLAGTRYRTLSFLGQGGMGAVWLVEDSILRRPVALKILAAENSSVDLAARLIQEATVLARLEHPGIVPVHDAGTLPDGRTFYCMKHVEGKTLDRHIDGLLLRQRLLLFQRIAEPLAFAHSRGIIHRDLKPANIMVGAFGEVLIMDWGLAKVMNATSASSATGQAPGHVMGATGVSPAADQVSGHEFTRAPLKSGALAPETTAHGTILGTPGYMAPEQERGELNLIDPRTDVFALGSILQYLLQAESSVPSPLRAICNKSMASEMAARYPSVQELAADVAKYLDGMPVSAYRENIFERTARLVSRNRVAVVLVLAYLFMRLLFILFSRR